MKGVIAVVFVALILSVQSVFGQHKKIRVSLEIHGYVEKANVEAQLIPAIKATDYLELVTDAAEARVDVTAYTKDNVYALTLLILEKRDCSTELYSYLSGSVVQIGPKEKFLDSVRSLASKAEDLIKSARGINPAPKQ